MRIFMTSLIMLLSSTAFAQSDLCAKYSHNERYTAAIKAVASLDQFSFEELCTLPKILDIEAQPSRVITPQGDVIPHVQLQLHMSYQSCLYMVRDTDKVVTSSRCYSGW